MSSPKKTKCSNCDKEIDSNKFFLHERFCEINVRKCSICKEPVQKDEYEEHKSVEHADPICAFCHKAFPNTEYDSHIKNCSKKLYECQYCGLFMNPSELKDYADLLYNQALLIEGFSIKDPIAFSKKMCDLIIKSSK